MKKILIILSCFILFYVSTFAQPSSKGSLDIVDTSKNHPTTPRVATNMLDNLPYYWDKFYWYKIGTSGSGGSFWANNGNSISSGAFVGTTNNLDFILKRNGVTGLTLKSGFLEVPGNMNFVSPSTPTAGIITYGGNRFIHNFKLPGTDGDNTFIGNLSGNFTMSGSSGVQGSYNVGVGAATLLNNTTGFRNTAVGTYALTSNTTAVNSTAFGYSALYSNTTGINNTAVGVRALGIGNTTGQNNSAFGVDAIAWNVSGQFNAGFCTDALYNNTTGSYNSAFGDSTAWIHTVGIKNTFIGSRAGYYLGDTYPNFASVKDSLCTFLGAEATRDSSIANTTALKNLTVIGYNAKGFASNQVVVGNDAVTTTLLKGSVGLGTNTPNASAKLEIVSTAQGFLPPRMTATQASAIASPAEGLLLYVTNTNGTFTAKGWWGWSGAAWEKLNN